MPNDIHHASFHDILYNICSSFHSIKSIKWMYKMHKIGFFKPTSKILPLAETDCCQLWLMNKLILYMFYIICIVRVVTRLNVGVMLLLCYWENLLRKLKWRSYDAFSWQPWIVIWILVRKWVDSINRSNTWPQLNQSCWIQLIDLHGDAPAAKLFCSYTCVIVSFKISINFQ